MRKVVKKMLRPIKKSVVALSMGIVLSVSTLSMALPVFADNTTYYEGKKYDLLSNGDYSYVVVDGQAVIMKYSGTSSAVTLPTTINSVPVVAVGCDSSYRGKGAFQDNSSMQTVVIPSSIKKIDDKAFMNCTGLQQVLVGSGVTEIGNEAFKQCSYMQKIQFTGDALETIGEEVFEDDYALDSVILPAKLKTIGRAAFRKCTSLSAIDIPDSVTELGAAAFAGCTVLAEATIGNGVTSLSSDRDHYINGDSDYYVDGTFEQCTSLAEVRIGNRVKEIGIDTFANTALQELQIPDNVVTIDKGAFYNCDSLTNLVIGNGVKTIGDLAFYDCNLLREVKIGKRVHTIGNRAFQFNRSLENIIIPSNVIELGGGVFAGCTSMTSAVIGNGVTNLQATNDHRVNSGCDYYRDGAFEACTSLKDVTIGDGVRTIGADAFANTAIEEIVIPDNVTSIADGAFWSCANLKKAVIGDGVTSIEAWVFYHCDVLKEVKIGSGVVSIGNNTFKYCTSLEELNLPSNIASIGGGLCAGDTSLKKVIVGNGIVSLNFDRNHTLNAGAEYYEDGAFEGCTSLTDVSLGNGLTSIGSDTFASTKITSLMIPSKVSSIANGLAYNGSLEKLYFAGVAPEFGEKLFGDSDTPAMYYIDGKSGYTGLSYPFQTYTPITIKFDINDNDVFAIAPTNQIMAPTGGYVIEPISPMAENYMFLGWYHDKECTQKWDFLNDKVTEDVTIYAKWVKTSEAVPQKPLAPVTKDTTDKTASIQWEAVSGATGYNVYLDGKLITTKPVTECTYNLTNLEEDTTYEVTVTALNSKGESENSLVKVVKTTEEKKSDEGGSTQTPDIVLGDLNHDGKCNLLDASITLKISLGIQTLPKDVAFEVADVNNDKNINLNDAKIILKVALGINKF